MRSAEGPDGLDIGIWQCRKHIFGGFACHRMPPEWRDVLQWDQNEGTLGDAGMGENQFLRRADRLIFRPELGPFAIARQRRKDPRPQRQQVEINSSCAPTLRSGPPEITLDPVQNRQK